MGNACKSVEHGLMTSSSAHYSKQSKKSTASSDSIIKVKYVDINEDYDVDANPIGKGTFGNVYRVTQRITGLRRAAKRLAKKMVFDRKQELKEQDILRRLDHPNIIRIFQIFESQQWIYIVMELCTGGELFDRIVKKKRLSQSLAAKYFEQILSAVTYCHCNNIIHRDLKPENVLFLSDDDDSLLKIIDFGASRLSLDRETMKHRIGTSYYIAPEVLKKNYNQKCDVWSSGVILFIMLSGEPPFNGRSDKEILSKVETGQFVMRERIWKFISQEAKDLVSKLLQLDPKKRLSANEALKHPWIVNNAKNPSQNDKVFLQEAIDHMIQFKSVNRFQEGIMAFMSNLLTSEQQRKNTIKQFKLMDKNGDGVISRQEFFLAYSKANSKMSVAELDQLFRSIDKNNSGFIDYTEFESASMKRDQLLTQKHLEEAFTMIDIDGNGRLSRQELSMFVGPALSEQMYGSLMERSKQHTEITRAMFMDLMMQVVYDY